VWPVGIARLGNRRKIPHHSQVHRFHRLRDFRAEAATYFNLPASSSIQTHRLVQFTTLDHPGRPARIDDDRHSPSPALMAAVEPIE
jgi:hypothetical protein